MTPVVDFQQFRRRVLDFVDGLRMPGPPPGRYRYSHAVTQPTLYASTYAAMLRSLVGELDALEPAARQAWIDYLNGFQDDDGLYRDPVIFGQGWYAGDPLWCGRPHLTCHVVSALACLGGIARRPLVFLTPWKAPDRLVRWLAERDWGGRVAWTGNEIMNVGTLLQYARDFHHDAQAGRAVQILLDWLDTHHLDPDTGLWGHLDLADPLNRSHAVQAAYHWWALYFYDRRPVPARERAIDTLLATQNPEGSFGWGVHNAREPFHGSACEDIDSIDPLARLSQQTDYRYADIRLALERAAHWLLRNQMPDGGFVFLLGQPFTYGHEQLRSAAGQGALFPTWFRTLTLAQIGRAIPDAGLGPATWCFVRCPGYQFA